MSEWRLIDDSTPPGVYMVTFRAGERSAMSRVVLLE